MAFHGFVEGDDIAKGTVDVVVTDGFTGNIALKTAEGTARLVGSLSAPGAQAVAVWARLGAVDRLGRAATPCAASSIPRPRMAAFFLGLNGVVVKSHGGADAMGFASALDMAIEHGAAPTSMPASATDRSAIAAEAAGARAGIYDPRPHHRLRRLSAGPTSSPTTIWPRAWIPRTRGSASAPASASAISPPRAKRPRIWRWARRAPPWPMPASMSASST